MRITSLIVVYFFHIVAAIAASPQPVLFKLSELQQHGWYQEQADLWESYLQTQPTDAEAWWNGYLAHVYAGSNQEKRQQFLSEARQAIAGSFQLHPL